MMKTPQYVLSLYEHLWHHAKGGRPFRYFSAKSATDSCQGSKRKRIIILPKKLRKQIKEEKIYQRYFKLFQKSLGIIPTHTIATNQ